MYLFYIPEIENDKAFMDRAESAHCIKVLRLSQGDKVHFVDGKGSFYTGVITRADLEKSIVSITGRLDHYGKKDYDLHIAIAPTKSPDRIEWFIEKAVEIGIDRITPIVCRHSERRRINKVRFHKKAVSAMKQSVKAELPVIDDLVSFESFMNYDYQNFSLFIAYGNEKYSENFQRLLMKGFMNKILILIGPEGDFSEDEIQLAKEKGFIPVSFGGSRLRTETAGIVATQIISDINHIKMEYP